MVETLKYLGTDFKMDAAIGKIEKTARDAENPGRRKQRAVPKKFDEPEIDVGEVPIEEVWDSAYSDEKLVELGLPTREELLHLMEEDQYFVEYFELQEEGKELLDYYTDWLTKENEAFARSGTGGITMYTARRAIGTKRIFEWVESGFPLESEDFKRDVLMYEGIMSIVGRHRARNMADTLGDASIKSGIAFHLLTTGGDERFWSKIERTIPPEFSSAFATEKNGIMGEVYAARMLADFEILNDPDLKIRKTEGFEDVHKGVDLAIHDLETEEDIVIVDVKVARNESEEGAHVLVPEGNGVTLHRDGGIKSLVWNPEYYGIAQSFIKELKGSKRPGLVLRVPSPIVYNEHDKSARLAEYSERLEHSVKFALERSFDGS
jgi:hypothetical protein